MSLYKIKDAILKELKVFWGAEESQYSDNTSVIKTNNLTYEGYINFNNIVLRDIDKTKINDNYLQNGDLLIEKSGGTATHSVGYVNIFNGEENKYVANNFILALRPNVNLIRSKFLFYNIKYLYNAEKFSDCFNKTTGIQNLKKDKYLSKEIKFLNFKEQDIIIDNIEEIEKQISTKNNQLLLLDNLIKSRFIGQEVAA